MSASLTVHAKAKAELAEQISFTPEQRQLMKDTVAKGVSDNEFMLFMHLAQHYGLDPFAKEVWCIKYGGNPATIFTSRDGYLKIASRDPQMNGIVSDAVCANDTMERQPDGRVKQTYGNPRGELVGAWAVVHRKDRDFPAYFYAPFKEYNSGSNPTWKKYPSAMIIKVAEAMALKRAFSISGLVTQEEIGLDMQAEADAGTSATVVVEPAPAEPVRVHVPGTVATQAEIDVRELAGHRTRFEQASTLKQVAQIWAKLPRHLAEQLLDDKEAAKLRLDKPAPTAPAATPNLTQEFVDQSTTDGAAPVEPVTARQKEQIIRLLAHPLITKQEQTKMLLNINRLDTWRAAQAITKLNRAIDDREGITPSEMDGLRRAAYRMGVDYEAPLGTNLSGELLRLSADGAATAHELRELMADAKVVLTEAEQYAA
ncbi:MAG: RecT family recombinase [Janthinobacterium lividum]